MKELLNLFWTFFKIGLTTFGGGYAMLPILEREIVEKREWATSEELANYYAIGQCTPGVISVNTATFIGYKKRGIVGGIVATLGVITPSVIIILLIANLISGFADYPLTQHIFSGIKICVSALIISAILKLWKSGIKDKYTFAIFLLMLLLSTVFKLSPVVLILIAGILGLFGKEKKEE